jgi:hypothetical protein
VDNESISFVVRVEVVKGVSSATHNAIKLLEVEHAVSVTVGLLEHFLELVVRDLLADLASDAFEVLEGDLVEVVLVEELEDLEDLLLGVPGALREVSLTMREVITPENSLKFSPSLSSFPSSA